MRGLYKIVYKFSDTCNQLTGSLDKALWSLSLMFKMNFHLLFVDHNAVIHLMEGLKGQLSNGFALQ